jgi:hypothetical protein
VHGALCVAYSGQCYISHAHTGRSANRGECSQACRLPYQVVDAQGPLRGARQARAQHEGQQPERQPGRAGGRRASAASRSRAATRTWAMSRTSPPTTAVLLDALMEERAGLGRPAAGACSSGAPRLTFTPDPNQNFNREFTDYFVNGRQATTSAHFDSPKNPGPAHRFCDAAGRPRLGGAGA